MFDQISADNSSGSGENCENDGMLINVRNPEERLRSKVRNPEISRHWGQMYHLALVKPRSSNISRGSHPFSFGLVLKYLLCRFWPGNQDIVGLEFPNAMVEMSKYLLFHNASGCNCRENSLQIFTATTFDALSVEEIVAGGGFVSPSRTWTHLSLAPLS